MPENQNEVGPIAGFKVKIKDSNPGKYLGAEADDWCCLVDVDHALVFTETREPGWEVWATGGKYVGVARDGRVGLYPNSNSGVKWTLLADDKIKYEWGLYVPENMSQKADGSITVGTASGRTEVCVVFE